MHLLLPTVYRLGLLDFFFFNVFCSHVIIDPVLWDSCLPSSYFMTPSYLVSVDIFGYFTMATSCSP